MIEEQAQVIEIKGNKLLLQAKTQSACGSCAANKGCGTSVLSKVVGRKFSRFYVENNISANVGDKVIVGIAEDALLKGSLVMYLVPVLGMLLFALLADYLFMEVTAYADLLTAAAAILGLLAGASLSRRYFQHHANSRLFTPVVLRKIIDHAKL